MDERNLFCSESSQVWGQKYSPTLERSDNVPAGMPKGR
jgi:hypothetical protein